MKRSNHTLSGPPARKERLHRLSRTINSTVCSVTGSSFCYILQNYEIIHERKTLRNGEGKVWEKCGDTERKPESTEHGVRNGNSYGLDSLIKFNIHIHSFAGRKSVQVAASSLVLPVASLDGSRGRVFTRVHGTCVVHVFPIYLVRI